jgi:purine-binding chemotaxis protein CheW
MPEELLENAEEATVEALSVIRQFVTFVVGDEVFAVDMEPVQEIIRMPEVVRVPLAPVSMDGLFNLRGKILPIISLRSILGFKRQEHHDSTRALIIGLGQPLGFIVDRVASVISIDSGKLESIKGTESTINAPFLSGVIKEASGFPLIMVLDFARLVTQEFEQINTLARMGNPERLPQTLFSPEEELDSDDAQLVSFAVAGQEYAIDIAQVQEIVQVPEFIIQTPNSAPHILGLISLRDRVLPLVSLRSLFILPPRPVDDSSRIVVIISDVGTLGLVTDNVSEVLRVPKSMIEDLPGGLSQEGKLSDITQICRLSGGTRLVSIINANHLFQNALISNVLEACETISQEAVADPDDKKNGDDEDQIVVFRLGDGEFGAPIASVNEIVRVPEELTHVPKAPDFVEGVINLRGNVVPVIDQRKRLDLPATERTDCQRIMVLLLDGVSTGLVVDAVTEVLKVPKNAIIASPNFFSKRSKLLGQVVNLEQQKRLIQLIDPTYLSEESENREPVDRSLLTESK